MKSQGPWVPGTTLWRAPHRTTKQPHDHIQQAASRHPGADDAMEHVTHGITLDGVARFVDIATDALSSAREEIDALNVYPVPDGDTGTNMFLTVSAARDALREALASDPGLVPGRRDGRARPRRAPGGARQLRGDPQPDAARLRAPPGRRRDRRQARPRRSRPPWPRRPRPATPPSARPSRARSSAWHAPRPTPRWRRPAAGRAPATCSPRRPRRRARPSPVRRSSSTCWPRPGSSTPAVAGCASCSTRSRRRPPGAGRRRASAPIGTHLIPVAAALPRRRPHARTARPTR